jgi:hypothetical protein
VLAQPEDVNEIAGLRSSVEREHLVGGDLVAIENETQLRAVERAHAEVPRQIQFGAVFAITDLEPYEARTRSHHLDRKAMGAKGLLDSRREFVHDFAPSREEVEIPGRSVADTPYDQGCATGKTELVRARHVADDQGNLVL